MLKRSSLSDRRTAWADSLAPRLDVLLRTRPPRLHVLRPVARRRSDPRRLLPRRPCQVPSQFARAPSPPLTLPLLEFLFRPILSVLSVICAFCALRRLPCSIFANLSIHDLYLYLTSTERCTRPSPLRKREVFGGQDNEERSHLTTTKEASLEAIKEMGPRGRYLHINPTTLRHPYYLFIARQEIR